MEIEYYERPNKYGKINQYAKFDGNEYWRHKSYYVNKHYLLHDAIYLYYHSELDSIPKDFVIHHKDFNKLNNDISNLQLLTRKEHSSLHSKNKIPWNKGISPSDETRKKLSGRKREKNHNFISFTSEQIQQIIKYRNSGMSYYNIGKIFNVSKTPISRILKENSLK